MSDWRGEPTEPLKPCPFCGGVSPYLTRVPRFPELEANYEVQQQAEAFETEIGRYAYTVVCSSCACEGGWGKSRGSATGSLEHANAMKPRLELIAAATAFAVGVPPSALRSRSRKRLIVAAPRPYGLLARVFRGSYPQN